MEGFRGRRSGGFLGDGRGRWVVAPLVECAVGYMVGASIRLVSTVCFSGVASRGLPIVFVLSLYKGYDVYELHGCIVSNRLIIIFSVERIIVMCVAL
jgi:hypothetical protein